MMLFFSLRKHINYAWMFLMLSNSIKKNSKKQSYLTQLSLLPTIIYFNTYLSFNFSI